MIQREVEIINKLGLHARASAKLVTCASRFRAEIELARGQFKANAKSIMGVMMLAAGKGVTLSLVADGEDEEVAISELLALIANRFGEPE